MSCAFYTGLTLTNNRYLRPFSNSERQRGKLLTRLFVGASSLFAVSSWVMLSDSAYALDGRGLVVWVLFTMLLQAGNLLCPRLLLIENAQTKASLATRNKDL